MAAKDGPVTTITQPCVIHNENTEVQRDRGKGKDHCHSKERGSHYRSSSSHADDADTVTDLCNLTGGQDTFTGGEVVLESDRCVSAIWELGPRKRDMQVSLNQISIRIQSENEISEPKERKQLLPIPRLRHSGAVRGLRRPRRQVCGEREPVRVDELDVLWLFQWRRRGRGEHDGRDAAVTPFLLRRMGGSAKRRRLRRRRYRKQQSRGRFLGLGGIPFDAGFDHEVDRVAILDGILLQQLGVRQRLALQQESLRRGGRGAWLRGDLGLDGGYRVCGGDRYGGRERRLERLERDLESGRR
jgi:hypothetical protein